MVPSKYSLCDMENSAVLGNLNYFQYLSIVPIKRAWFVGPKEKTLCPQ